MVVLSQYDEKAMVDSVAWLNPVTFSFDVTAELMHYKEGVYPRWDVDLHSLSTHSFTVAHEQRVVRSMFDIQSFFLCFFLGYI